MGNLEQPRRALRIAVGVERAGGRRAIDRQPRPAEDEQVEIELARAPAPPLAPPEGAFEPLERDEQGGRAGGRIGATRDVEGDDGVPELGLVLDPDRPAGVEARDGRQPDARQGGQGPDRGRERPGRVAEIRTQADPGAGPSGQGRSSAR